MPGYVVIGLFAVTTGLIFVFMSPIMESLNFFLGLVMLFGYGALVCIVAVGFQMYSERDSMEPTEWMKRGGLMAAPSADAHVDEGAIRAALSSLPDDAPADVREKIEAYLAMPNGDEQQLTRDHLIRMLYDRASSSHEDYRHRKAYSELRAALRPWPEE